MISTESLSSTDKEHWTELFQVYDLAWPPVSGAAMPFSGLNRGPEFSQHINLFLCGQNEALVAYLRGKSFGQNELNYKNH